MKGMVLINKLLDPKIDYVFKRIFGYVGNEKITTNLLSSILDEKVEDVTLDCNTVLEKDVFNDKIGILDIKAKFNHGVTCDIEMQVVEKTNIYKRLLFYWSKMYIQNIETGEDFEKLKRCVVILIADFELDNLSDINKYITRWEIKEENYGKQVLTDLLKIAIIELPKAHRCKENNSLDTWVKFIENPEVIDMSKKENEAIKEARQVLEEISNDEKERYIAELRQKYIMDQKAIEDRGLEKGLERGWNRGLEKGLKQGLEQGLEQGIKDGMEQGLKQGLEQGLVQGIKEGMEQVAQKMLEKGIDIKTIIELTGLTKEKIESLNLK